MPKKDDDYVVSESGNWNVAAKYSELKIMKHLYLADEYQTIATFGSLEFFDELEGRVNLDEQKIKALDRLIYTLILVIDNCKFAIKIKDQEILEGYKKELVRFKKILKALYKITRDQRTKSTSIKLDKDKYEMALDRITEIKSLMNDPLNKADLIFTHREEFDYNKFKEQKIREFIDIG